MGLWGLSVVFWAGAVSIADCGLRNAELEQQKTEDGKLRAEEGGGKVVEWNFIVRLLVWGRSRLF